MNRIISTIFILLASLSLFSQNKVMVRGMVIDDKQELPLPGATVVVTMPNDSVFQDGTITGLDGLFTVELAPKEYIISISFLGFNKVVDTLHVNDEGLDLGAIKLSEEKSMLKEINVVSALVPTLQRGDTTLLNPDAFKVNMDATANDLLLKMPGFYTVEGKLMAMGDTIREVLMDGKKFFGNDISKALEMIPPKIIKGIEVYQYKSEGTKQSGFEESTEGKTVNIVTNLKTNAFVRSELSAGKGKDDRYAVDGFYSRFMESNRVNVYANKNNVQVPLRINRGRSQNSISGNEIENTRLGTNLGLSGKNTVDVTYSLLDTNADNKGSSKREYVAGVLSGQTFEEDNNSNSESTGHNVSLRLGSNEDVKKSSYFGSFNFGSNNSLNKSETLSETHLNEEMINSSSNSNTADNQSLKLNGDMNFRQKLNDKGRALSLNLAYSYSDNEGNNKQLSETKNGEGLVSQSINQLSHRENSNTDITLGVSYNEKLGEHTSLSLGYRYRNYNQESDKRTMDYDEVSEEFLNLDTLTSNTFDNLSNVHVAKMGFKHDKGKLKTYAGLDMMNTNMESKEVFPYERRFKETFMSFQPNAKLSYTTKEKRNYTLNYNLRQQIPSLKNLQEIVNNSNPLYISTGNPNLKLSSTHNVVFSMSKSKPKKASFFSLQMRAGVTNNVVTQNRVVAKNDTLILGSYFLPAGGQFSSPINLDGRFNIGVNGIYSFPLKKLKSKLNSRSMMRFSSTPNILNGVKNKAMRMNFSQEFTLASNINEKIDFTIQSNSSYSIVDNNTNTSKQNGTFSQRTSVNLYYNFYKKFIFKTNTSESYTGAYGSLKSRNRWFVNLGLSKKLFADNQGEISFSMFDIANDQSDLTRNVSDLYISETYSPTMNKFYMMSFSYKI